MSASWLGEDSAEEADQPWQVNKEFATRLEVATFYALTFRPCNIGCQSTRLGLSCVWMPFEFRWATQLVAKSVGGGGGGGT